MYIGYAMCIILWQIWQKHGCGASAWQPFFRHVFSLVSNLRGSQGLVWGEAAAATLLGICRDALVSSVGTTSNKHDHLGSNCQAMYELGIATGMLLAALLNLLLQAIGGFFTNWSFSLRRSMSAKSWRVIWGHMGSYGVMWCYMIQIQNRPKKQKQPGFPVATSRGEVPGGCRQVVDVSIHFGGLITNWN